MASDKKKPQRLKKYDPKQSIVQVDVAPRGEGLIEPREITVHSYQTTVPFDYDALNTGIESAWLTPALSLGVFERRPHDGRDAIHVVLGFQDALSVRAYDYEERRPLYYSWRNLIVETTAIRYTRDSNGCVHFTTYGGGHRITDERLDDFNSRFLKIPREAVEQLQFDLLKLRKLAFGLFVERLYMLRFSDVSLEDYRTIDHAQFQSRKYIDPTIKRLQEPREDPKVTIEAFDSDIEVKTADLAQPADVRFAIRGTSGALRLRLPQFIYRRQFNTLGERSNAFYKIIEETVKLILNEDYYAAKKLSFEDIETTLEFPLFADTKQFRERLRHADVRGHFFAKLDLTANETGWLPHVRALDELLAEDLYRPPLATNANDLFGRDTGQAIQLLNICRTRHLLRLGAVVAEPFYLRLQDLPAPHRLNAEEILLAWAIENEFTAWDLDPDAEPTGKIHLRNLRFEIDEFSLDVQVAILWKLVGVFHDLLLSSDGDMAPHLAKLGWCISAAQRLPPTLPKLPFALRLVAARRVPNSPRDADGILREPVQDLAALDDAILEQFNLPLWPKLQAVRVGDEVLLRNDGIGAAISVRLDAPSPPNGADALAPFALPSGAQATLKVATSATVMALTFSKYGSVRRVVVPIARDATAAVVASARTDALRRTMDRTRRANQLELRKKIDKVGIVLGTSPPILDVFEQIAHANMIDGAAHVLLLGETGVGKSMFARLVHQSSSRAEERYAEFFASGTGGDVTLQIGTWVGYGKGHGIQGIPATGRDGHLVGAQRGTLFIDEFALLSHDIQGVLLAVLEKKPTNKVGGEVAMLDVRCIFATNEDPAKLVKEGKLRADLLHRIGSRITIPPLRERIGDILLLARHFAGSAHPFSEQVELALLRYSWPGNIRELEALVKKAKAKKELDAARRIALEHIDLPEDLIAGVRTLSDEECQRELWALVDQVAQAEGYEHGTGLQKRAAEIMGVQQPQASKMYASHGLARAD